MGHTTETQQTITSETFIQEVKSFIQPKSIVRKSTLANASEIRFCYDDELSMEQILRLTQLATINQAKAYIRRSGAGLLIRVMQIG